MRYYYNFCFNLIYNHDVFTGNGLATGYSGSHYSVQAAQSDTKFSNMQTENLMPPFPEYFDGKVLPSIPLLPPMQQSYTQLQDPSQGHQSVIQTRYMPHDTTLTKTKTAANSVESEKLNDNSDISDCTAEFFQGPFVASLGPSLGSTSWESTGSAFSRACRQTRSNSGTTDTSFTENDTMIPKWNPCGDTVVNSSFPRVNSVVFSTSKDAVDDESNDTTGTGHTFSNSPTMIESLTTARTVDVKSDVSGAENLDELCDEVASYYLFSAPTRPSW